MKSEIEAALEHQDPHLASEGVLSDALAKATSDAGGDGPIVFMPRQVVSDMHAQFQPLGPALKGVQLSTTALKRAVLPFSPSYYFGNAIDNAIRTALAGIGPQHFYAGHQLSKSLSEERKTQLLGAAFSSVEKLAAHRSHEDFTGTALQGCRRCRCRLPRCPGPETAHRSRRQGLPRDALDQLEAHRAPASVRRAGQDRDAGRPQRAGPLGGAAPPPAEVRRGHRERARQPRHDDSLPKGVRGDLWQLVTDEPSRPASS